MITPEDFLKTVSSPGAQGSSFKIGSIASSYTSGRPAVKFDGESTASTRTYPYLSSYTPQANDRVLVAIVGHSGVVVGKII